MKIMQFKAKLLLAFALFTFGVQPLAYADEGHFSHAGMMSKNNSSRTTENYTMPNVTLVDQDGKKIKFDRLLKTHKPIFLNFIFATCTTICPVLAAGFSSLQNELKEESKKIQFISITIDPEHDQPSVLKEYSKRFRASKNWTFLTGSREDIDLVMEAFDAYVDDKMKHRPLTFIKAPNSNNWVKVDGLMSTMEYMNEYKMISLSEHLGQ